MVWLCDGRVDVEVVDDVLWVVPPLLLRAGLVGLDLGRDDLVVPEVEVVLRLLVGDDNLVEPLDGPPTDLTGNDQPERKACESGERAGVSAAIGRET